MLFVFFLYVIFSDRLSLYPMICPAPESGYLQIQEEKKTVKHIVQSIGSLSHYLWIFIFTSVSLLVTDKKTIRAAVPQLILAVELHVVGKHKIHLCKLSKQVEKIAFDDLFSRISQRVQINSIFTENVRILCLSCNAKMSKEQLSYFTEQNRNKRDFHRFPWYSRVYIVTVA